MGANGSLAVTPGSGTTLITYDPASGGRYQYIAEICATAVTHGSWTLSSSGQASQIAADVQRVSISVVNNGTARVYFRYDSTIPSSTVNHWYIDPGDRWEVPYKFVKLAMSVISDPTPTGAITYALGTVA